MKYILLLLLMTTLYSETTFITPLEYASRLYKDPRGIGCQHCHGDRGEGKLVVKYIDKDEEKIFFGPSLQNIEFSVFLKGLSKRKRGMPRYYLTMKEVQALYLHVNRDDENLLTTQKERE